MHPYQTSQAVHRLIFILSALCLALATGQAREAGDRPNVVVFFLDDSGYGDFAHHGNPTIRTENISKLAQEEMNFTQFSPIFPITCRTWGFTPARPSAVSRGGVCSGM